VSSFKKSWWVRSYPEAVAKVMKAMPRIYTQGCEDGVLAWVGRTFAHQRKDFRPKPPALKVEKPERLVFQHDLVNPATYTIDIAAENQGTRVTVEVRLAGIVKENPADAVLPLLYALTRALEPEEPPPSATWDDETVMESR